MSKLGFNKQVRSVFVIFTHSISVLMVSIMKVTEYINSIKSYLNLACDITDLTT